MYYINNFVHSPKLIISKTILINLGYGFKGNIVNKRKGSGRVFSKILPPSAMRNLGLRTAAQGK